MIEVVIRITIMGVVAVPFVMLTRAENRMCEKKKAQGKPVPWI